MKPTPSTYHDIRDLLDTGDIIAFGGTRDFIGRTIRFFTRSAYHHVAVVYRSDADRVTLIESSANYGGVRGVGWTYLSQRIDDSAGTVDVFRLGCATRDAFDTASARQKCYELIGRPYDFKGAALSGLGQWLRIPGRMRHDALFCSELADAVHAAGGIRHGRDWTPTPEEIIKRPIYGAIYRIKGNV